MIEYNETAKPETKQRGSGPALNCFVSFVWGSMKMLFVCLACMLPGHIVVEIYGFDGVTALPLFWGGMIYITYLRN